MKGEEECISHSRYSLNFFSLSKREEEKYKGEISEYERRLEEKEERLTEQTQADERMRERVREYKATIEKARAQHSALEKYPSLFVFSLFDDDEFWISWKIMVAFLSLEKKRSWNLSSLLSDNRKTEMKKILREKEKI